MKSSHCLSFCRDSRPSCLHGWGALLALFLAPVVPAASHAQTTIESEDFNVSCNRIPDNWHFLDARGDCKVEVRGVGTEDASLLIHVAGGASHDLGPAGFLAPCLMQAAPDTDFEVEARFDSPLSRKNQGQGICVEESAGNYLRFDFVRSPNKVRVFAASLVNNNLAIKVNSLISSASPPYLRVQRQGNQWTQRYSYDGSRWVTAGTFSHVLRVTHVGVYALNSGTNSRNAPTHTAVVDYFFNVASPISPEDGAVLGGNEQKILSLSVQGSGTFTTDPPQASYFCGQTVTVTATPAPGFRFEGWSGDLAGSSNPASVTMNDNLTAAAIFAPIASPPVLSSIQAAVTSTSATITWTTDHPASSAVDYGLTASLELGGVESAALVTSHRLVLSGLAPSTVYRYRVSSVDADGEAAASEVLSFTTSAPQSITLQWDAPSRNVDGTPLGDLAGYRLYLGAAAGRYDQAIDVGRVTQHTLAPLPAGTWHFAVTARDLAGNESQYSNDVSLTVR